MQHFTILKENLTEETLKINEKSLMIHENRNNNGDKAKKNQHLTI